MATILRPKTGAGSEGTSRPDPAICSGYLGTGASQYVCGGSGPKPSQGRFVIALPLSPFYLPDRVSLLSI